MEPSKTPPKKWSKKKKLDALPPFTILVDSIRETLTYLEKERLELDG